MGRKPRRNHEGTTKTTIRENTTTKPLRSHHETLTKPGGWNPEVHELRSLEVPECSSGHRSAGIVSKSRGPRVQKFGNPDLLHFP
eukprot:13253203-Alexandrium_andersonii.AAC.1